MVSESDSESDSDSESNAESLSLQRYLTLTLIESESVSKSYTESKTELYLYLNPEQILNVIPNLYPNLYPNIYPNPNPNPNLSDEANSLTRFHGQMGTSMEDAFKHFDKDGCGFITREGFSTGLEEMGVFQEFSEKEVEKVSLAWTFP